MLCICAGNIVAESGVFTSKQGLHSVKTFSAPHSTPPLSVLGMQKEVGEPADQRDIPVHMLLEKKEEGGDFQRDIICHCYVW